LALAGDQAALLGQVERRRGACTHAHCNEVEDAFSGLQRLLGKARAFACGYGLQVCGGYVGGQLERHGVTCVCRTRGVCNRGIAPGGDGAPEVNIKRGFNAQRLLCGRGA